MDGAEAVGFGMGDEIVVRAAEDLVACSTEQGAGGIVDVPEAMRAILDDDRLRDAAEYAVENRFAAK